MGPFFRHPLFQEFPAPSQTNDLDFCKTRLEEIVEHTASPDKLIPFPSPHLCSAPSPPPAKTAVPASACCV